MCILVELSAELKAEALSTHRSWNLTLRQRNYHVRHNKIDNHVNWPDDICMISLSLGVTYLESVPAC